ncbi:MAG TPA: acyl carrier protein [Bryobacteraceae bacterium]|nr:acyl carrier protein [Bryobacteraceae bacterium]
MDNLSGRLARCFETVFPDLPESEIQTASQQSLSTWDSVAAITLANVIEDEFAFQLDFEDLADLDSFERIHTYLAERLPPNQN